MIKQYIPCRSDKFLAEVSEHWDFDQRSCLGIESDYWRLYRTLRQKYSFAIPTEPIIQFIVSYSPLCEVGAGLGYWAHLIDLYGGDIIAYDLAPLPQFENNYIPHGNKPWFDVQKCSEDFIPPSDRTLFLCWPPYSDPMAYNLLTRYEGQTLIYIGEGYEGSCADDNFFEELEKWQIIYEVGVPQFYGIYDRLTVYHRPGGI